MQIAEVLIDAFGRIREEVERVLEGLDDQALGARVDPEANSIAWLIWHLTRVQDDHLAKAFDTEQAWTAKGWAERFALPFDVAEHGYGHTSKQVGALSGVGRELLGGYHEATWRQSVDLLGSVTGDDLDRVVDTRWTPAVTLGVRLVSVIADDLQHVGQAAYVRGLIERSHSQAG
ncbi:MAG: DinB family protein [Micrococcales bacterium]|nr:DinB family protein [Micrococcales bacterium]